MSFQIGFNGPASDGLQHLLRAVEGRLNWHGVHAQAAGDATGDASAASTATHHCKNGEDCKGGGHIGHEPAVVIALVIGLAIGLVIGYIAGKRSGSVSTSRP